MKYENDIYDLFNRYFSGNATPAEKVFVDEKLKLDSEFREEFEFYRIGRDLVIENRLKKTSEAIRNLRQKKEINPLKKYLFSISLVLLSGVGIARWMLTDKEENSDTNYKTVSAQKENNLEGDTFSATTLTSPTGKNKQTQTPQAEHQEKIHVIEKDQSEQKAAEINVPEKKADPLAKPDVSPLITKQQEETSKLENKNSDPCHGLKISAEIQTIPTCAGKKEGEIEITSGHGGKSPYEFTIDQYRISGNNIGQLAAGVYEITVTDYNGCAGKPVKAVVKEKNCFKSKDFSFNPFQGEKLTIEPNSPKKGTLKVLTKAGIIWFNHTFQTDSEISWDGVGNDGNIKDGFYLYIIEFSDGTVENGTITIVQ